VKAKWLEGWGENFPTLVVLYIMAFISVMLPETKAAQALYTTISMLTALWLILQITHKRDNL